MKIALVPLNPTVGDIPANVDKILGFIDSAIAQHCDLIIFPEMSLIGYPAKDYLFYPWVLYQQQASIAKLKRRSKNIGIVVGGLGRHKGIGRPFLNQAFIFHNGQKHTYTKQLLPNYDVFDDWRYFSPGTEPLILKMNGKRFGFTICEDIWFSEDQIKTQYPQDPLNQYRDRKLDFLINISASPFEFDKPPRRAKLISHISQTLHCQVIYVNQSGANDDLIFDGSALVCHTNGKFIYKAPPFTEDLFVFNTDEPRIFLPLKSSKSTKYELLEQALITGIRDYFGKMGFTQAALGLSGGVDSALVATLAAKALGPENVLGVMLPSRYSSDHSITDSQSLAKQLGIQTMQINIDPLHKVYEKFFHKIFPQGVSDLTEQNIQARIRANLLMAISNNSERLLLNTSNKSELAMGFGTMYGDLCGAIAVISDLTKTQVYELCGHLNLQKEIIPKNILKKAPSAELKPDQKDSDTLPPYDKLDPLLDVLINQYGQGVDFDSCDDLTRKVMNTIMKNEWKRFQAPPTLRISNKAYGAGRRIPVVGKLRI